MRPPRRDMPHGWTARVDASGVRYEHESGAVVVIGADDVVFAGRVHPLDAEVVARGLVEILHRGAS